VDITCGWQVKLCDPSLTRAIPERFRDEFVTINIGYLLTQLLTSTTGVLLADLITSVTGGFRSCFDDRLSVCEQDNSKVMGGFSRNS